MLQSILGRYQDFYGMVCIDVSRQSQTKSEPEGSRPLYCTVVTRSVQNLITCSVRIFLYGRLLQGCFSWPWPLAESCLRHVS